MKETAVQVNERKIRNGIRKQREKIEREQQKVWDRLKDTGTSKKADWNFDTHDDIVAMHGIDVEKEIRDRLVQEIIAEAREQAWADMMEQKLKTFLADEYNERK